MYGFFASELLVMLPEITVTEYAPTEVRVARPDLPSAMAGDEVMVNGPMYFRASYAVRSVQEGILVLRRSMKSAHGVGEP